jgi:hypothetical protein
VSDATRDQVWDFLREKTRDQRNGGVPFSVFLRVFHGWSGARGLPLPIDNTVIAALEAAGYPLVLGNRGERLVDCLGLYPRGQAAPE